jgi:hypothetical protein
MSWVERVKEDIVITCGEGSEFTPLYLNAKKLVSYNIAEFDFPNINGTLVTRKASRGNRYALELIFQGEDVLDVSDAFELASRDSRAWKLSHPFYGDLKVHPISLEFDNSRLNTTVIKGQVIETLGQVRPSTTTSPVDRIVDGKVTADATIAEDFAANVEPTPSDIVELKDTTNDLYGEGSRIATGDLGAEYFNAFTNANSFINNATSEPLAAMNAIQNFISAPARFQANVSERLGTLTSQFTRLTDSISNNLAGLTPNQKRTYQANGATLQTTTAEAVVTGEYQTAEDALETAQTVLTNYNTYVATLDGMQTEFGSQPNSYIPDFPTLSALEELVNETVSELFEIALNSRQERRYTLVYPSDPITLTNRFYGLDNADENLQLLIDTNNIGLNELLELQPNREIIYYVG